MRDDGEIREFLSKAEAEAAGFTIPLTKEEAERLKDLPKEERLPQHVTKVHGRFLRKMSDQEANFKNRHKRRRAAKLAKSKS